MSGRRRTPQPRGTAGPCLALLAALAAGAAGCASYSRGSLEAAATGVPPVEAEVVAENVVGRACSSLLDIHYGHAVEAALRKAPGANALMDVTSTWEGFCVVVRGTAVRLAPGRRAHLEGRAGPEDRPE